jgi:hypothetical protein
MTGGGWQSLVQPAVIVAVTLSALALACSNDDPAVAPLVGGSGSTLIQLELVGGQLAGGTIASTAGCPTPEPGYPEDVVASLTVTPASGTVLEREIDIPAGTEVSGIQVNGLNPGSGYRFELVVNRAADGERLFSGEIIDQTIRPGVRELLNIPLIPVARRAVLGIGQSRSGDAGEIVVPILASHSDSLRGIQFDLCFDRELIEVTDLRAVGRLADFDGVAGGEASPDIPFRVVLWSTDGGMRLPPGRDEIVELTVRFRPGSEGTDEASLVFTDAIVTDQPDPVGNFVVYFLDGRVTR